MHFFSNGKVEGKSSKLLIFVDDKQVDYATVYLDCFQTKEEQFLIFRKTGAECRVTIDYLDN
jgi:hypothetical protein